MLSNYSIVMLKKDKYVQKELPIGDFNPRLLIIRVITTSKQYIVRYPNGFTDRINEDWLRGNGIYEVDHPTYPTHIVKMAAAEEEYKRNEPFRNYLTTMLPNASTVIMQNIEAKNQMKQKLQAKHNKPVTISDMTQLPTITAEPEEPTTVYTTQDQILNKLTSIDNTLKAMLELWKGDK